MAHSAKEVMETLQDIAREMELDKQLHQVIWRKDYEDYQIVLDNTHHCEIRAKLMDVYIANKDKDVLNEIRFRLEHATEYDEWEKLDSDKREAKDDNPPGIGGVDEDF